MARPVVAIEAVEAADLDVRILGIRRSLRVGVDDAHAVAPGDPHPRDVLTLIVGGDVLHGVLFEHVPVDTVVNAGLRSATDVDEQAHRPYGEFASSVR